MHTRTEKYTRSLSIFAIYVQYVRVSMDHKGVNAQALTDGIAQRSTSLLDLLIFGPVKFVN